MFNVNLGLSLKSMQVAAMGAISRTFGVNAQKEEDKAPYSGVGSAMHYSRRSPGSAANKKRRRMAQTRGGRK